MADSAVLVDILTNCKSFPGLHSAKGELPTLSDFVLVADIAYSCLNFSVCWVMGNRTSEFKNWNECRKDKI